MPNRYVKRSLMSLIIREMQIKTTVRYHFMSVGMAIINTSTNTKFREDVDKREPLFAAGGSANWCGHCGKQGGGSSKN